MTITASQARALGNRIKRHVEDGGIQEAYSHLAPVLAERTPFPKLGIIGEIVGQGSLDTVNQFLFLTASYKKEGGWVVIGTALRSQLTRDLSGAMDRARAFIIEADVWYGADILGERVPGPALIDQFDLTLDELKSWRRDHNHWARRTVGVAIHFWAKRTRGEKEEDHSQAAILLDFIAPMFWEWEMSVVKGVGWGLKTIGKYYPNILIAWLEKEILPIKKPFRALMFNKAVTYLPAQKKMELKARTG